MNKLVWDSWFLPCKILVNHKHGKQVIGLCGIRSKLNYLGLYVDLAYRNKRVGTSLLHRTLLVANKKGLGFVLLLSPLDSTTATHLYQKHGFSKIMRLEKDYLMFLPLNMKGYAVYVVLRFVGYLEKWIPQLPKIIHSVWRIVCRLPPTVSPSNLYDKQIS